MLHHYELVEPPQLASPKEICLSRWYNDCFWPPLYWFTTLRIRFFLGRARIHVFFSLTGNGYACSWFPAAAIDCASVLSIISCSNDVNVPKLTEPLLLKRGTPCELPLREDIVTPSPGDEWSFGHETDWGRPTDSTCFTTSSRKISSNRRFMKIRS